MENKSPQRISSLEKIKEFSGFFNKKGKSADKRPQSMDNQVDLKSG